ncbi:beta-ketoacyl-[acyl-carrier-protein] synthase family protein [Candidatus Omnitrophota bacterium]
MNSRDNRRVVVTGLGVVSSIGIGWQEFWKNCIAGKSGISKIESFDTSKYDRHFGGEVKDFQPEKYIDRRKLKMMGRASQLAIGASKLAIEDSKLDLKRIDRKRMGICIGTTMGECQVIEEIDSIWTKKDAGSIGANLVPQYQTSALSANVGTELGLKDVAYVFSNACAAGNYSIGYGYDLIRSGKADYMLAGGSDALSRISFTGFSRLYSMAPEKCQPFDKNRQGMLLGEGAGIVVLESLQGAQERKASIYAEILGYGLSCDAYHMTAPSTAGIMRSMRKALSSSDISSNDVDYISTHGTGTVQNDKSECSAIKKIFGGNGSKFSVSSIKSMLGHAMGAASAIEAIACCLAIKDGVVPPTINHETPDPECDIDCVPNKAKKQTVEVALNNSYAFGGNNASLALRKCNG